MKHHLGNLLWTIGSGIMVSFIDTLGANPDWTSTQKTGFFFLLWAIIGISYPLFFKAHNYHNKTEPKSNLFSQAVGNYILICALINGLLPVFGIKTLPWLNWYYLPSFNLLLFALSLGPAVLLIGGAVYTILANIIYSLRTKTLY